MERRDATPGKKPWTDPCDGGDRSLSDPRSDQAQPREHGRRLGVNDALTAIASIGLPLLAGPLVALAALAVASEGLLACHFSSCWDCTSPVRGPMGCQPRTRWTRRI